MNIYCIAAAVILSVSGVFASLRHFQMLQQNSYYPSRYFGWLKGSFSARTVLSVIFAIIYSAMFFFGLFPVLAACSVLSLYRIRTAFRDRKKSIKKLVITARMKRMLTAEAIVCAAVCVLTAFFPAFTVLAVVLAFASPVCVLAAWTVTYPIEKAVARYYINDAKRLLKSQKNLTVIGITGSYGKTGTKYILGRILSEKYNTLMTPESFNTPMGVVRTVRESLTPNTEIFIAEMGAKRRGDIDEICRIADPDIALITSVGPQHLDTFGNIETVLKTKLELADCVRAKNGNVYFNGDCEYLKPKRGKEGFVSYGTADTDGLISELSYSRDGLKFIFKKGDTVIPLSSRLLGAHNALNIAGAVMLALDLGVEPKDIIYAVSSLKPVPHRLEMKPFLNGSTLIDDAYNSNPVGCMSAVRVLGSFDGMQKIIVTPGLVELGEKEYGYNFDLGLEAAKYCDKIILVGKERSVPMRDAAKSVGYPEDDLFVVSSFKEALGLLGKLCDGNTAVLFENDLPDNYLK